MQKKFSRKIHRRDLLKLAMASAASSLFTAAPHAWAQSGLPPGPIRFIIPYSPGTGADTTARSVGVALGEKLGRPVVVDNRPGASTMLGTEAVVRAPANGSTLLITTNTMVINRALYPKANFDPLKDLTPITLSGWTPMLLVASTQSGFKSTNDLLQVARKSPGRINYGSPGVGTLHHLAMEMLKIKTKTSIVHIPYSGSAPAVTGLLSGQIDVMFLPVNSSLTHIKSGRIVPLAIGSDKRSPLLPDLRTLDEEGYKDMNVPAWFAIYGPPNMATELVASLNNDLREILASDDTRQKFAAQGIDPANSTAAELKTLTEKDAIRWAEVIKQQRITAE